MQQIGFVPSQPMSGHLRCFCTSYKCHAAFDEHNGLSGVLVSRRTYDRHRKEDEDAETTRANSLVSTNGIKYKMPQQFSQTACISTETSLGTNNQWLAAMPDVDIVQSSQNASLIKENSILSSRIEAQQ